MSSHSATISAATPALSSSMRPNSARYATAPGGYEGALSVTKTGRGRASATIRSRSLRLGTPADCALPFFGERPDISPDNPRVAFMAKSFGDAFVIDLKARVIRCLTCNVPGAAFLRVMHLANGDYLLIGPDHFEDIRISRSRDNELWYLSK